MFCHAVRFIASANERARWLCDRAAARTRKEIGKHRRSRFAELAIGRPELLTSSDLSWNIY